MPAALVPPKNVGCTFKVDELFARHHWKLRLRPGGALAVVANGGTKATMSLPVGDHLKSAFLELDDGRAKLNGWLNGADVRFSAKKGLVIDGYPVPFPWTALSLRASSATDVRVGHPVDPKIRLKF